MNRQAWRDFFITVFFLGLAFVIALLSSVAADQQNTHLAAIAAAVSLVLALIGALYIIPRLARNVRLELLRFAIRTSVTVEGLLFIVFLMIIAFAAWNNGNNLLYLVLSAMLAFLIAANMIARISLADVSIQLRFPDHIFAGEPANISVTLLNHKRFMPSYSLMVEALTEGETESDDDDEEEEKDSKELQAHANLDGAQKARLGQRQSAANFIGPARSGLGKLAYFVLAPARSSARQRIDHTFKLRGRYPITGFRIATKFPAGFFKKWKRIDATGEILVYPKPQPLDDFYHALPMLAGQIESHARGSGDDLYGIRRYHPSDHMRYIDWKATAKSMSIMVREHMREDEWRLTIVFDTAFPAAVQSISTAQNSDNAKNGSDPAGESTNIRQDLDFRLQFERAVLMAASLANHFILERAEVELITTVEQHDVRSGSGQEHLYRLLASLATLQPTEAPTPSPVEPAQKRGWSFRKSAVRKATEPNRPQPGNQPKPNGGVAWRLLDEVPVLRDERRFKVLITSAKKGTIPGHIWRSSHVVFMEDL